MNKEEYYKWASSPKVPFNQDIDDPEPKPKVKKVFPWPLAILAVIYVVLLIWLIFDTTTKSETTKNETTKNEATTILNSYKDCTLWSSEPATYASAGSSRWIYRCKDSQGYTWTVDVLVTR